MVHLPLALAVQLGKSKSCLFTRAGKLLWFGDGWRNPADDRALLDRILLGRGWQEFAVEPDLARLLAWFADGEEGTRCDWHVLWPTGSQVVRVAYVKVAYCGHWLVLGEVHAARLDLLGGWDSGDLVYMI